VFLYTEPVPKSSAAGPRWLIPVLVAVVVLALATFTPRLPGDQAVSRFIQAMGIGSGPASAVTSLAMQPTIFAVLGVGMLLATWRGRLRGLVTAAVLILFWWYAGEPLKTIVQRPRPTADLVEVVRASSGFSFPSTFATAWYSAWLPVAIYAWRTRQRAAGMAVAIAAGLLILVGAWARIRMGAHWPSDLLMTLALVWSTFALIELAVDRLDSKG